VIQIGLFHGAVANPVVFAVVAGKTAFSAAAGAPDRFYYEVRPNAATYAVKMPMDMQLEYLGDGSGAVGQVLHPSNVPVYYGRQQLWEATPSATTTSSGHGLRRGRHRGGRTRGNRRRARVRDDHAHAGGRNGRRGW
jgi:hypothetical protein